MTTVKKPNTSKKKKTMKSKPTVDKRSTDRMKVLTISTKKAVTKKKTANIKVQPEKTNDIILCGKCNKPKSDIPRDQKEDKFCKCGNPTTYKEEYAQDMLNYFEETIEKVYYELQRFQPTKEHVKIHYETFGKDVSDHEILGGKKAEVPRIVRVILPTFQRRRAKNRIPKTTFLGWRDTIPEFSTTGDLCKEIQEAMLIELGMAGVLNAQLVQLMLKNNHEWSDKTGIDLTSQGKSINPPMNKVQQDAFAAVQKLIRKSNKKDEG